jgi:hypothetical protein
VSRKGRGQGGGRRGEDSATAGRDGKVHPTCRWLLEGRRERGEEHGRTGVKDGWRKEERKKEWVEEGAEEGEEEKVGGKGERARCF